jgi:hypothetical protein
MKTNSIKKSYFPFFASFILFIFSFMLVLVTSTSFLKKSGNTRMDMKEVQKVRYGGSKNQGEQLKK